MITQRKKPNNKRLWLLVGLLVLVLALMWMLPDGMTETPAAASAQGAEQPAGDRMAEAEAATRVKVGDAAPDFRVELFDGSTFTLSSLRGKVVLLNFWATWCPPCREELARVPEQIVARFAGRDDFVFLPVSRGESREEVAAFRERTGYTFPMGLDPDEKIFGRYAATAIPRNFLIGRDGRIVETLIGYEPEEFDALVARIGELLDNAEQQSNR